MLELARDPVAQEKSTCQQYCGAMAALVASAEKECPDPGAFDTAACRTWDSKALGVGSGITTLPQPSLDEFNSALGNLGGFHDEGCGGKSSAAGASTLSECQAELVRGIIDLGLAREDMAGSRAPDEMPTSGADHKWTQGVVVAPVSSSALARLRHASTSAQVSAALVDTDAAAQAAVGLLGVDVPALPADSTARDDLGVALTELFTELESKAANGACGVSAPALGGLSAVGAGTAYTRDLPKAIREMAAAGYPVPLVLPAMPAQYNRRLGDGKLILDTATGGPGDLGIVGSFSSDAVVELVTSGRPVVEVYVQENGNPDVNSIPDGSYDVYVETGADWDSSAKSTH